MNDYITTEKLKREIEKLGLEHESGAESLYIEDNGRPVANISLYQPLELDTCYDTLNYKNPTHLNLYNLLDRYARTPLDKREEQKRYRLKLDISDKIDFDDKYLCELISPKGYVLETRKYCSKFSQPEIDEMGDLTRGFIKEEVCEN